jgi:hypothetical protein
MARATGMESLDQKIKKAQTDVVKTKQRYDAAVARLSDLMDKRDAIKRDELTKTIMKSNNSYEEIMQFLNSNTCKDE